MNLRNWRGMNIVKIRRLLNFSFHKWLILFFNQNIANSEVEVLLTGL